jgi:hypothetical protein
VADDGRARPGQPVQPGLDDLAGEAAVLRVYRQAFAVLAREAEKMILTPQLRHGALADRRVRPVCEATALRRQPVQLRPGHDGNAARLALLHDWLAGHYPAAADEELGGSRPVSVAR